MVTLDSSPVPAVGSQPVYHHLADPLVQTDEQLMIHVQQRNIGALETLFDRYAETGMRLALRILQDRELADQVLVKAFWRVWGYPRQYQWARGSFSDLFSGIIWHLALDELDRKEMRPLPQVGASSDRRVQVQGRAGASE